LAGTFSGPLGHHQLRRGNDLLNLAFSRDPSRPLKILCLGAHSDDIEFGCGGTVLRLLAEREAVEVDWVVLSAAAGRREEAQASANHFLDAAALSKIEIADFRDSYFPYQGAEIKNYFEELKRKCTPDVVFTHYGSDLHQDHRLVSELTWNTFRDHLILEYEIFKYDGDLGRPNFYCSLSRDVCERKISSLLRFFPSQKNHQWFTADTFAALLRLRGAECNAPESFAEGFYCRKARF
jgi:LmbE family N-acetylglucosaminyl deacetylase